MLVSIKDLLPLGCFDLINKNDIADLESDTIDLANSIPIPVAIADNADGSRFMIFADNSMAIVIDGCDRSVLHYSLQHEVRHYQQALRGDLVLDENRALTWKGKSYTKYSPPVVPDPSMSTDVMIDYFIRLVKYLSQPWEWYATEPDLQFVVGEDPARSIRAARKILGTTWKDEWDDQVFAKAAIETRSVRSGYNAVSGITY